MLPPTSTKAYSATRSVSTYRRPRPIGRQKTGLDEPALGHVERLVPAGVEQALVAELHVLRHCAPRSFIQ